MFLSRAPQRRMLSSVPPPTFSSDLARLLCLVGGIGGVIPGSAATAGDASIRGPGHPDPTDCTDRTHGAAAYNMKTGFGAQFHRCAGKIGAKPVHQARSTGPALTGWRRYLDTAVATATTQKATMIP